MISFQNRDCVRLGPPAEGDAVQVRWTDGLIYGAKFVASHSIPMYLVNLFSSLCLKDTDILKSYHCKPHPMMLGFAFLTTKYGWSGACSLICNALKCFYADSLIMELLLSLWLVVCQRAHYTLMFSLTLCVYKIRWSLRMDHKSLSSEKTSTLWTRTCPNESSHEW